MIFFLTQNHISDYLFYFEVITDSFTIVRNNPMNILPNSPQFCNDLAKFYQSITTRTSTSMQTSYRMFPSQVFLILLFYSHIYLPPVPGHSYVQATTNLFTISIPCHFKNVIQYVTFYIFLFPMNITLRKSSSFLVSSCVLLSKGPW